MRKPFILGIGGAPFLDSSTERALQVSMAAACAAGAETRILSGPDLLLPLFDPRSRERDEKEQTLIDAIRACDGLIIASPSYHGSVSGLIKNALDYVEDLRTDDRVYLDGVAVGLIVCAGGWQGAGQTLSAMRAIVHALRGWPTPLGAAINTAQPIFDTAGDCVDLASRAQLHTVGRQVFEHTALRLSAAAPEVSVPTAIRVAVG